MGQREAGGEREMRRRRKEEEKEEEEEEGKEKKRKSRRRKKEEREEEEEEGKEKKRKSRRRMRRRMKRRRGRREERKEREEEGEEEEEEEKEKEEEGEEEGRRSRDLVLPCWDLLGDRVREHTLRWQPHMPGSPAPTPLGLSAHPSGPFLQMPIWAPLGLDFSKRKGKEREERELPGCFTWFFLLWKGTVHLHP
jgi:hypothetical protein